MIAAADAGGNLMLLHRIEGALLASIEIAINKAWSAVAFQAPTATLGPLATGDGPLPGLADTNSGRVVLFGGGVPVHVDGELAGPSESPVEPLNRTWTSRPARCRTGTR